MLSRCYAGTYALDENILIKGDNFHRLDARIPNVTSFHGKFINDIAAGQDAHQILEGKKVIFLVRNPIDVSISCYFHLFGGRSRPQKREMQGIPKSMDELPIDQFVISSKWSVENIIKFMNEWGLVLEKNPNMLLLKYEDMRASPAFEMGRVNTFLGGPFTSDVIDTAVSASSFDKLKEQERSGTIANSALQPRDKDDPNSYKVRRGKVGGYVDYLSPETIVEVENTATQELSPAFGYIPGNGAGDAA